MNYGVADGLRSAQCAPGYPTQRRWQPGAATDGCGFPPAAAWQCSIPKIVPPVSRHPVVHLLEVARGRTSDFGRGPAPSWPPAMARMQFRYTGIYLSAPERVRYSYRLQGLEKEWVKSGARRITNYNSLPHGRYRFTVRAGVPTGRWAKPRSPSNYFRTSTRPPGSAISAPPLAAAGRLGFVQFAAAPDSPAILAGAGGARQGSRAKFTTPWRKASSAFLPNWTPSRSRSNSRLMLARKHLDLARKMVRHSLTEARRSVMDLRASALECHDLSAALSEAGSPVDGGLFACISTWISKARTARCRKKPNNTCCGSHRKPSPTP